LIIKAMKLKGCQGKKIVYLQTLDNPSDFSDSDRG